MADLATLLSQFEASEDGWSVDPPEDWRQGRTLYGGLAAALCHEACLRAQLDLPQLRSAQIAFIGPSAGRVLLQPRLLRQGKSVTFMACDLIADGAVATRGTFVFGGARETALALTDRAAPDVPAPEDCEPLWPGERPSFTRNLDQRLAAGARPFSNADKGEMLVWVKLQGSAPATATALVAVADALPPAAMPRFSAPAMISTVAWQIDIANASAFSPARWHLIQAVEQASADGYSLQEMHIWNEDGALVLAARQSVAIFV